MGIQLLFLLVGIAIFGTGLGIGWSMRASVKEEDYHYSKMLADRVEKIQWGIDELKKKVK